MRRRGLHHPGHHLPPRGLRRLGRAHPRAGRDDLAPRGRRPRLPRPADDVDAGGDDRFDVYLADLSPQGYYGFCAPEDLLPGQNARATSYCVLDNDMLGLGGRPDDALAATAAHEFFHAVQFNYDLSEDSWFMESSATWVEEVVFDAVDDNRQFLGKGQLGSPTTPLDAAAGHYGNWIFVQFLAQRFGDGVVRRVWERLDASRGALDEWSLQGVRSVLAARGVAWPSFYADFARANLFPRRHYREGAAYRAAPVTDHLRLDRSRQRATRTAAVRHLSSRTTGVTVGALPRGRRTLRLDLRASHAAYARVSLLVHRADGSLRLRRVTLDRKGRATARIPASRAKVRRVVVLTVHTAADHRRCGGASGWACGGDPVGALSWRLTARLVR
ncbi:MXAN_6640 family putative metalloprotease [Nocardioides daphniae]|uniref:MXAN_6640 family putative metalloprotease n=1 Tax=Nocardioides daphniae TaxID=402297 RepID=UPI0030B864A0